MIKNLLAVAAFYSLSLQAMELKPFTTDGCSAFPDGNTTENAKWITCCIEHDFAYWKGGTIDERKQADDLLKQCVSELGEKDLSIVMHIGVRLGGSPFYPTWYRWGYGWPYLRGYAPLTQEEKAQVEDKLNFLKYLIDGFIAKTNEN